MPVDTSAKALNLATNLSIQAGILMDAVRELVALKEQKERGGIDFAPDGVPMDFSNTALKHINGDDINNVITTAGALKSWLDTTFNSDNLDRVRS